MISALHTRLEHGSKDDEQVSEFIRPLERTFKIAYGRDPISGETWDTLLHGQLQEGLRQEIMSIPGVSGAQTYKALCLAAKNEERRLVELQRCKQYCKTPITPKKNDNPLQRGYANQQKLPQL